MFYKVCFVVHQTFLLSNYSLFIFRILSSMVNYLKFLLNSEQKKTDFRPESEMMGAMTQTSVSFHTCLSKTICLCKSFEHHIVWKITEFNGLFFQTLIDWIKSAFNRLEIRIKVIIKFLDKAYIFNIKPFYFYRLVRNVADTLKVFYQS